MINKNLKMSSFLVLLTLAFFACQNRAPLKVQDEALKTAEKDNIFLSLKFIDEDTITAKFGKELNPFLTEQGRIQFSRIIVFELKINNQSEDNLALRLNRMELQFEKETAPPTNQFSLIQYWHYLDDDDMRYYDKQRRDGIITKYLLPDSFNVAPHASINGYIVFLKSFPTYGSVKVYIPVFKNNVLFENFQFNYQF